MALPFSILTASPVTEIYTLSLHDALPISGGKGTGGTGSGGTGTGGKGTGGTGTGGTGRSEEHTSELQSRVELVCRLLLEKKKARVLLRDGDSQRGNQTNNRHERDNNSLTV